MKEATFSKEMKGNEKWKYNNARCWLSQRLRHYGLSGAAVVIFCFVMSTIVGNFKLVPLFISRTTAGESSLITHTISISKSANRKIEYENFQGFTPKWNSKVQFVFFMGLEGTGHHFVSDVVNNSPAKLKWKELDLHLEDLQAHISKKGSKEGLMDLHCEEKLETNPEKVMRELVDLIQKTNEKAASSGSLINKGTIHLPFNPSVSESGGGFVSYPRMKGPCRKLRYPSVDMLYAACDEAKVDCGHVYLYRNPSDILISTTIKREFNKNTLVGIHLYTSLLKVITSDLHMHSERTMGCFNFFESTTTSWWDAMRVLWGWDDNTEEYEKFMLEHYKAPSTNVTQTDEINNEKLKPYMDSFINMHKYAESLCKRNIKAR